MSALLRRWIPAPIRRAIRAAQARARDAAHRLRWRARARHADVGNNVGLARFDGFDVAYRTGSVDLEVIKQSFGSDTFLPAIPEYALAADAVVLDVGAHIGTFALMAARKAPRGRVFAVEASRETFALLAENVAMNGLENVSTSHLALSDRVGTATLHHDPEGNYGHTITKALGSSAESVPATTLGRYLEAQRIARVDLAKFNCEGAELPILLSAPSEVLARIGRMIVLYHADLVEGGTESALVERMRASGFATRVVNRTADRGWIIATRNPG